MSIQAQAGEVANVKSVVVPAGATKAAVDDNNRLLVAAAVGVTSDDTFERAEALLKAGADAIVIDTAHVDIQQVFFVRSRKLRTLPRRNFNCRVQFATGESYSCFV